MFTKIRNLFAPKTGIRIMLRGSLSAETVLGLQNVVRSEGLNGWMQYVEGRHLLVELEGAKPSMESTLEHMRHMPRSSTPAVLDVSWLPYKRRFETFRVSM